MNGFLRWAWGVACVCLLAAGLAATGPGSAAAADYKAEYKLSVVPGATSGWGLTAIRFADLVHAQDAGFVLIAPPCAQQRPAVRFSALRRAVLL